MPKSTDFKAKPKAKALVCFYFTQHLASGAVCIGLALGIQTCKAHFAMVFFTEPKEGASCTCELNGKVVEEMFRKLSLSDNTRASATIEFALRVTFGHSGVVPFRHICSTHDRGT